MNWFRQNKFLGGFLVALALTTVLSVFFLLREKSAADAAQSRLESAVNELTRLRRSVPFPSEENLRKTRTQADGYRSSLLALENEMRTRMFPKLPIQPNEFQAQLRAATINVTEHAQAFRVRLPDNFHLGFDQYATSLPNGLAAPRLGRQLRAIEWLAKTIVEAHADSINSLSRTPLPEETPAAASTRTSSRARPGAPPKPASGKEKMVDWTTVDLAFSGSPAAIRRAFNQIAAAPEQFYILRTLRIKNQVDKGPPRGGPEAAPSISFIIGTEHVDVAAKVEIMKFNIAEREAR
ncbi:MAG TPA: Amuc_1100 family pilus-like protein [Chthoniobacterales bacterium]|jgi:hypothetical protein|nr:Amuc_1100 family pilus-like protein [Chthoniobacterales bacterium]